jgi:hypothetical protein
MDFAQTDFINISGNDLVILSSYLYVRNNKIPGLI